MEYTYYIIIVVILILCLVLYREIKPKYENRAIHRYLYNHSTTYLHKPNIWIHTNYEKNSREWKDFSSRNTNHLNEPYIVFTVNTVIDHCSKDFNIYLIDDDSFSQLLPFWNIDINTIPEPFKSHYREQGLLELVYYYGGMVIPNSFLCLQNMKTFYEDATRNGRPFVCEHINNTMNLMSNKHKLLFIPDTYIMGALQNDPIILEFIHFVKKRNQSLHFTAENDFIGDTNQWCLERINRGQMNLVAGEMVGIKTTDRKKIGLEELMENEEIKIYDDAIGIYIPNEEILKRPKFQWFAVLPIEQILESNMVISKYMRKSNIHH